MIKYVKLIMGFKEETLRDAEEPPLSAPLGIRVVRNYEIYVTLNKLILFLDLRHVAI